VGQVFWYYKEKSQIPSAATKKKLLSPNGQLLIDSSDIIYMFDNDEDGNGYLVSYYRNNI
jgi:hypothetical protein